MEQTKELWEKIHVVVDLDPSLTRFAVPEGEEAQDFRRHLLKYLNDLLEDLTISASVSLIITYSKNKDKFTMTSYQVTINEHRCRLPIPSLVPQDVQALELSRSVAKGVCRNLELFLPVSLTDKIREQWSSEDGEEYLTGVSPDGFHEFIVEFVRRYFRIDRARKFSQLLREKRFPAGLERTWNAKRSFEECISDWSTLTLRVLLPHGSPFGSGEYLKTQPATNDTQIENRFEMMRDGFFYELGVMVPKVAIGFDESLKEGEFRIQLNDLRFPPICGLRQGHFLVNDTVDRLSLIKISGEPAKNPANDSECAIVRDENFAKQVCEEAGLTTWGPEEFIVLTTSAEFRRNADAFLTTMSVEHSMNQLQSAFPALIDTTLERFSIQELTGILRELLDEEFSIRDLRGILESLLAIHTLVPRKQAFYESTIADQRIESLNKYVKPQVDKRKSVESLRKAFKRYLSRKYARDGKTLVVYLLDPEIERRILDADKQPFKPGTEDHYRLVKAIFYELGDVPLASRNAVVLTTLEVRKKLKNLIEREFPKLTVLCYQELDSDLNIQPVSRISYIEEPNW